MCIFSLGSSPSGSFTLSVYHIRWHPLWASSQFYFSGIILRFMRVWFSACLYSHFKLPGIFYEEHSCFQYKAFIWAFSPPNANIISSLIAYFLRYPHKLHIMKIKTHIFLTSSWCPFLYANMMNLNFPRTYFKIIGVIYYMIWARFFLLFVVWYVLRTNNFYISKLYYLALLFIKIKISNPNIHTIYFK